MVHANAEAKEDACAFVDATNLVASEIIMKVNDDTAVVRGTIKYQRESERVFFLIVPRLFKNRGGAD